MWYINFDSWVICIDTEFLVRLSFESEFYRSRYTISDIFLSRNVWLDGIIPIIESGDSESINYVRECELMKNNLLNGWKIGIQNTQNKPLNQKTYDLKTMNEVGRLEIYKDLTKGFREGKLIGWLTKANGYVPLFVRPKKINPITFVVEKWRVIRDGTQGTLRFPSLNMLTPDEEANIKLIYMRNICEYCYAFYLIWGPGFNLAKTDLSGAFRQLYLAITEPMNCGYKIDNKTILDFYDFWGTRSGSKHTQDVGQLVCRAFNILINGKQCVNDLNELIVNENITYFINKYKNSINKTDDKIKSNDISDVFKWNSVSVENWFINNNLHDLIDLIDPYFMNGPMLLSMNINTAQNSLPLYLFNRVHMSGFFDKLFELKINCRQNLIAIVNNYIDDYLLFLPPSEYLAKFICEQFSVFLDVAGLKEEPSKREGPNIELDALGFDIDSYAMELYYREDKKDKIKYLLNKALLMGYLHCTEYEKLLGKLQDVANLAWPAKAFLRRLRSKFYQLLEKYGHRDFYVIFEAWELKDLNWWLKYIDVVSSISIIDYCCPFWPTIEMHFDGATNGSRENGWKPGLGVFFQGKFIVLEVPPKYTSYFYNVHGNYEKDYAIAHFEFLAIILGLHTFRGLIDSGIQLKLVTDNKHVEGVIKNKNSTDEFLQSCLRWTCMYAVDKYITIHIDYIKSKLNKIPDAASRFDYRTLISNAERVCMVNDWALEDWSDRAEIPDVHVW